MAKYYAAFLQEKDGKYSVLFPDLLGCTTWGNTLEEAFDMAQEALEGHLEAMVDDNDPMPNPGTYAESLKKIKAYLKEIDEEEPETILLQLVPVPDVQEKPARVNVSFRKATLALIDKKAEVLGMTRSGFLARAAEAYGG